MRNKIKYGFTLIELLIVIVIIGILAVAVLSAINPIEQINKSKDAGMRSDANELLNAYERYYTTHRKYPWDNGGSCSEPNATVASDGVCIDTLVSSGELKPEFAERNSVTLAADESSDGTGLLYVTVDEDNLIHICFQPKSLANLSMTENLRCRDGSKPANGSCATGLGEPVYLCVPE